MFKSCYFILLEVIDELDGSIRKAIIPLDRIDRIVEFSKSGIEKPEVLKDVKSILYFRIDDKRFNENFRYIKQSIEEISDLIINQ